jgi:hypothetical protein
MHLNFLKFSLLAVCIVASSCGYESGRNDVPMTPDGSEPYSYNDSRTGDSHETTSEPDPSQYGDYDQNRNTNAGQVTAGEWNDLADWTTWRDLQQTWEFQSAQNRWKFFSGNRYDIEVTDDRRQALIGASVSLLDEHGTVLWKGKTDNRGRAQLWHQIFGPQVYASSIRVDYNGKRTRINNPSLHEQGTNQIQINTTRQLPRNIDVQFVVDATGSMSDEINFLKAELQDVMFRVANNNSSMQLNLGSVFYRDHGDQYVTRISNLSSDIHRTVNFVKEQSAAGGGDFEEAVEVALSAAINSQQWSDDAVTKIVFLLLDAPAHCDDQRVNELHHLTATAAEQGIRIIPITASGIDKDTEFLMRFLSTSTNGTYVFITDDSGIGNDHLEASVAQFEVEYLNDLMVRLIDDYSRIDGSI